MTLRLTRWRGWKGRAVTLGLALALTPLPVAASEAGKDAVSGKDAAPMTIAVPEARAKTSQVSLTESAARAAMRTPLVPAPRARRAAQDATGKASPSFFKTKGGAVALAVMVLGVGYALYSAKNDRITSPEKQ